jgi:hypothetical protein
MKTLMLEAPHKRRQTLIFWDIPTPYMCFHTNNPTQRNVLESSLHRPVRSVCPPHGPEKMKACERYFHACMRGRGIMQNRINHFCFIPRGLGDTIDGAKFCVDRLKIYQVTCVQSSGSKTRTALSCDVALTRD